LEYRQNTAFVDALDVSEDGRIWGMVAKAATCLTLEQAVTLCARTERDRSRRYQRT